MFLKILTAVSYDRPWGVQLRINRVTGGESSSLLRDPTRESRMQNAMHDYTARAHLMVFWPGALERVVAIGDRFYTGFCYGK